MRAAFALPFLRCYSCLRAVTRYVQRIDEVLTQNRKLKPVLITLTVKNGSDLRERADHLLNAFRKLLERRRDFIRRVEVTTSFVRFRALCIHTKTHITKKQVNGIRIFTCLH